MRQWPGKVQCLHPYLFEKGGWFQHPWSLTTISTFWQFVLPGCFRPPTPQLPVEMPLGALQSSVPYLYHIAAVVNTSESGWFYMLFFYLFLFIYFSLIGSDLREIIFIILHFRFYPCACSWRADQSTKCVELLYAEF